MLTGTNSKEIVRQTHMLLDDAVRYQQMARANNPYGDGQASTRIHQLIKQYLQTI